MAFAHHYPFDFKLLNDKGEDEFYLEDKIEPVNLIITNQRNDAKNKIEIDKKKRQVNDNYFHFALKFRSGTLNSGGEDQKVGDWLVNAPDTPGEDGSVLVRIQYTGNIRVLEFSEDISISFKININGAHGTRSTNVLLLDNISSPGKTVSRQINWTIINHRGKPNIPLELSFKDADTILNDGFTENQLTFRITNISKQGSIRDANIYLNTDSEIYIFFEPEAIPSAAALGSVSEVAKIIVSEETVDQMPNFEIKPPPTSDPFPVWRLKLKDQESLRLIPILSVSSDVSVARPQGYQVSVVNPEEALFKKQWTDKAPCKVGDKLFQLENYSFYSPDYGNFIQTIADDAFQYGTVLEVNTVVGYIRVNDGSTIIVKTPVTGPILYKLAIYDQVEPGFEVLRVEYTNSVEATVNGIYHRLQEYTPANLVPANTAVGYVEAYNYVYTSGIKSLAALEFKLSNVITNYITGRTRLHVRFENIVGYWDETFVLDMDKQPLIMRGQRVGIGTSEPEMTLDVKGQVGFNSGNPSDHLILRHDGSTAFVTAGGADLGLVFKVGNGSEGSYDHPTQNYKEVLRLMQNGDIQIGRVSEDKSGAIDFGAGIPGKQNEAGRIGYGLYDQGSLCIVGAGNSVPERRITLWAEGGATLIGSLNISGDVASSGNLRTDGNIKSLGRIQDSSGFVTPVGGVIMYNGSVNYFDNTGKGKENTPVQGWAVCNSQNGTPDLRGRFIVGASLGSDGGPSNLWGQWLQNYPVNATGGEEKHTLSVAEMPKHTHNVQANGPDGDTDRTKVSVYQTRDRWADVVTLPAGEDQPHENRPPYYALIYIMKL